MGEDRRTSGTGSASGPPAVRPAGQSAAVNGAPAEFEDFYRDHYLRLLKALIIFSGGDVDLAVDALDEAMVVACERWDSIKKPAAYVRAVAIHKLIKDRAKTRKETPTPPDEMGEEPDHITGQAIWEQRTWVTWLLKQLPKAEREVLACIIDELSSAEIAELLGKTPAAVRQNLSATRKRLRKYLADNYGAEITAPAHGEEAR